MNAELENGKHLAEELVRHMHAMGANGFKIPVLKDDEQYEVSVTHVPVEPEKE